MPTPEEISNLCRLCLEKRQVSVLIFEEQTRTRSTFVKISSCLPVKVSKSDALPKKICEVCSGKLDSFYEFWKQSSESEKQLQDWLKQPPPEPAPDPMPVLKQEEVDFKGIGYSNSESAPSTSILSSILQTQVSDEPPLKKTKFVTEPDTILHTYDSDEEIEAKVEQIEDNSNDSNSNGEAEGLDYGDDGQVNPDNPDDQPGPSGVGKSSDETPFHKHSIDGHSVKNNETTLESYIKKFNIKPCRVVLHKMDLETMKFKIAASCDHSRRGRQYVCYVCLTKFSSHVDLFIHKQLHEDENREDFNLPVTEKKYSTRKTCENKTVHKNDIAELSSSESDSPYSCLMCSSASIKNIDDVKRHTKESSNEHRFFCALCNRTFNYCINFCYHIQKHSNNQSKAKNANESTPSALNVQKPREIVKGKYNCNLCDKVFEDCFQLHRHYKLEHRLDKEELQKVYSDNNVSAVAVREKADTFNITNSSSAVQEISSEESIIIEEPEVAVTDAASDPSASIICNLCFDVFGSAPELREHLSLHQQLEAPVNSQAISDKLELNRSTPKESASEVIIINDDDNDSSQATENRQTPQIKSHIILKTASNSNTKLLKVPIQRFTSIGKQPNPQPSTSKSLKSPASKPKPNTPKSSKNVNTTNEIPASSSTNVFKPLVINKFAASVRNSAPNSVCYIYSPNPATVTTNTTSNPVATMWSNKVSTASNIVLNAPRASNQAIALSGTQLASLNLLQAPQNTMNNMKLLKTGPTSFSFCLDGAVPNTTLSGQNSSVNTSTVTTATLTTNKFVSVPSVSTSSSNQSNNTVTATTYRIPADPACSNNVQSTAASTKQYPQNQQASVGTVSYNDKNTNSTGIITLLKPYSSDSNQVFPGSSSTSTTASTLPGVIPANSVNLPKSDWKTLEGHAKKINSKVIKVTTKQTSQQVDVPQTNTTDANNASDPQNSIVIVSSKETEDSNSSDDVSLVIDESVGQTVDNDAGQVEAAVEKPKIFVKKLSDLMEPKFLEKKKKIQSVKTCDDCNMVFNKFRSLRMHIAKRYKCEKCSFESCKAGIIRSHYHDSHSLYFCVRCKVYVENCSLMYKHNNENHTCNFCRSNVANLALHLTKCSRKTE